LNNELFVQANRYLFEQVTVCPSK